MKSSLSLKSLLSILFGIIALVQVVITTILTGFFGFPTLPDQTNGNAQNISVEFFLLIVMSSSVALVLAIFMSRLVANRLSRIFQAYSAQVQAIADGQFDLQWPQVNTFEYHWFGQSLQGIAEKFRRREKELLERKRMEQAIKENEQRLELALLGANEGIWDWYIDRNEVYFDSCYYTMAGYAPNEFAAKFEEWEKRVHKNDIERVKSEIEKYLAGELDTYSVEFRFLRKDNRYMWILGKGKVVDHGDKGNPTRFIGTHTDITQRRQMEESLRLTQYSFDNANIGIYRISSDAQIVDVNPKAAQMLGYSKEKLETLSILDIDPGIDEETWSVVWQGLIEHGSLFIEREHRRQDGSLMPVDIYGSLSEYEGQRYSIAFVQDISSRKQMEQTLKDNEERLEMALSSANEGIWDRNLDPDTLYFDSRYYTIAGYLPDEFPPTFEEWTKRVHKDDVERVLMMITGYLKGEQDSIEVEYRFQCKDGRYMWALDKGKIVARDDNGAPLRVIGTHADITQRRKLEESLRLTQFIFDKAPIGIWRMGSNGEVLDVNEHGCSTLGYTREQLCRMSVFDFAPQFSKEDWDTYSDRLQQGQSQVLESLHQRNDGEIFPIQVIGNMMWFGDQQFHVAFVQDISERKQDEEELHRLRNYLSNIIDSMPSQLIGVDRNGFVTQWNRTVANTTGIDASSANGKNIAEILPWMATEIDNISESIRSREVIQEQKKQHLQEDGMRYEDVTIYPLITNGVEGAVIRIDDVTEKVRMEEMMVQSEKMLSVGGLAAGMAHEINNPLAGMMQTADVMASRLGIGGNIAASEKAAKAAGTNMDVIQQFMEARGIFRMVQNIRDSGQRVAEIVENMLSFARKSDTSVSTHSLEELIDKTLELAGTDYDLKKQHDFRTIDIVRDFAEQPVSVPCEAAKIQQVLLNLFRNGAQAMQDMGTENPRIVVRTRFDRQQSMGCIEVEDNGPGMDETTRKRVFEPFFTTKPVGIGTGLGLSVSYFIITENHNGKMVVESKPGEGTKFIIHLPGNGR